MFQVDGFWYKLIENVLLAFLPVLASLAVGALYAWARKTWAQFKEHSPDIAYILEEAASMAVMAAEQAGAAGYITEKKEYALGIAQAFLNAKGIKIDLALLDAAIEAAVFKELNSNKIQAASFTGLLSSTGEKD